MIATEAAERGGERRKLCDKPSRRMAGACLLVLLASACGDVTATTNTTVSTADEVVAALTIQHDTFSEATVVAATEFTISNKDAWAHTVTDDGGTFDVRLEGGTNVQLVIIAPGTYRIHCDLHGAMHGTITVT